jgi:hypothetical protein
MAHYVETEVPSNKADWLLNNFPEILEIIRQEVQFDSSGERVLVCVIDNGDFEAAGVCCNVDELKLFMERDDFRWKRWLVVPRSLVLQLRPQVGGHLPESKRKKA